MASSLICGMMNSSCTKLQTPTCSSPPTQRLRPIAAASQKIRKSHDDDVPIKTAQSSPFLLAASLSLILCSSPANAGLLSGSTGLESIPGPELPKIDFLNRWNEENQKKYAENDARFKESPLLKKLLEKSNTNKAKNKQAIMDKYCIRGAEWGVGDCSAAAMTPEDRDSFIAMLKQKAGVE